MKGRHRRTTVAAVITTIALGLPTAAWFVTGSRAAREQADRVREQPSVLARAAAERAASRLAVRLEALRRSEGRRAITDYHRHDPALECACDVALPSPLAEGPADPLVWTHFQIDEVGQLTLPNFDPNVPEDPRVRRTLGAERAILDVLECSGSGRLATLGPQTETSPRAPPPPGGEIIVEPLRWYTVTLDGESALVALREVVTPTATRTQGFVVLREALMSLAADREIPLDVESGEPAVPTAALLPIEGPSWSVIADASAAKKDAAAAADRIESRFRRSFGLGLLGVIAAGGLILTLVFQTERLAIQRARFAASAAHELRTPLAGLRMYGELLLAQPGDPAQMARYARRIAGEAERLGRVVTNLLAFARLERGALAVSLEPGDLAAAVRNSIELLRPGIEVAGARLETEIAPAPILRFDRDAVHQILQNLIDNAEKYSRGAADRTIRILLEPTQGGVTLSVADHGPGVAPGLRSGLFEAFARGGGSDSPDGLGLGLALVQALARAHGGTVDYVDNVGGGACFRVRFPARAETAPDGPRENAVA